MQEVTKSKPIKLSELTEMAKKMYEPMVKADVDLASGKVLLDMPMHADGEARFIESGSKQQDVWGINLHPAKFGTEDFVEFDSMINIRPGQNNFSRYVEDEQVRQQILSLISEVVHE
jgi:hypothetical protein